MATQTPDSDEDITNDFILTQAQLGLQERFTQPIVTLRNGTWLHSVDITTTNGVDRYRLPARAIVQGIEKVECAAGEGSGNANTSGFYLLNVQTNIQATDYEGRNSNGGPPAAFTYQADNLVIFPPPATNWTLRVWYYVRPSDLVLAADFEETFGGYVVAVTSNGDGTYDVELDGDVLDGFIDPTPFDFQYTDGNCELIAVNAVGEYAGVANHMTVTLTANQAALLTALPVYGTATTATMQQAEYSAVIPLPQELCNALVSYVSAVVLAEKGDSEKAQVFSQKAELAIKNTVDVALPRSKGQPSVFKTRNSYLRRRVGRWGFGY